MLLQAAPPAKLYVIYLPPSEIFFHSREMEREKRRGVTSSSLSRLSEEREVGSESVVGRGRGREEIVTSNTKTSVTDFVFVDAFLF